MYGMKEKGFYVPQYGKNHGKYFGRWRAKQIDPDFISLYKLLLSCLCLLAPPEK